MATSRKKAAPGLDEVEEECEGSASLDVVVETWLQEFQHWATHEGNVDIENLDAAHAVELIEHYAELIVGELDNMTELFEALKVHQTAQMMFREWPSAYAKVQERLRAQGLEYPPGEFPYPEACDRPSMDYGLRELLIAVSYLARFSGKPRYVLTLEAAHARKSRHPESEAIDAAILKLVPDACGEYLIATRGKKISFPMFAGSMIGEQLEKHPDRPLRIGEAAVRKRLYRLRQHHRELFADVWPEVRRAK
jgi:hypothetical protein